MFLSALINTREEYSTAKFSSINPANGYVVDDYGHADVKQCENACLVAREAFQKWSETPSPVRASVIANFASLLVQNKEALAKVITSEVGKPYKESLGEVQEAIDTCYFFISEGRRLYGQTIPSEMPDKECFTYRRPVGVFACITASNFPVAVPSWYFVPALLCGNTCVWKPSEDAPKSAQSFYHLLIAAGIPKGVFNVVFGGSKTGADLISMVDYGLIDKVGFTGSTEVGKKIGEVCGRNLQVPCLELGGKNPLVVMPDANLDMALEGVVWAAFGTAGQRCTSLGNLILHKDIYEEFVDHLLKKVESLVIGNPMRSDISYGPMISQRYLESHLANLSKIAPHHQVITKKNGRIEDGSNLEQGFYAYPTIVANVQKDDYLFQNETFGPLFNIAHPVSSLEEAIDLANGTKYGLSSAIYTSNMNAAYRFKSHIKAGMTSINNSTTGAEAHLPFGGNGWSGNGSRQSGIWVVDQFTRWQSVNMDLSGKLQLAQMDTSYITPKECIL